MKLPGIVPPPDLPTASARIPGFAVQAVFVIAGVLLSLVDFGLSGWLGVGIALSVAAAWSPRYLLGWGLILHPSWTAPTRDGSRSAQFEHSLLVTPTGVEVLTLLPGETR